MGSLVAFDKDEMELNAKLKPQLHSIHAKLKLDDEVTKTNVAILETLLADMFEKLKQNDRLFSKVFKRPVYTGSYYDGLRTKKADEFDINIVMDLPFRKGEFNVLRGCPGYVGYEVGKAAIDRLLREGDEKWVPPLLGWMDRGKNTLMPDKVKKWLQSAFDKLLQGYAIPSGSCTAVDKIKSSQHGPAKTFYIVLKNGHQIDVDLVPVIEFRHPCWPKDIEKKPWISMVPLQTTRDSYSWKLSSYSLKSFVMSQLLDNYDPQYWDPKNQGMLFVRVLERLGFALAQQGPAIPFLFHPDVDLAEQLKRVTRENISCTIMRIVRKLRLFPDQCCSLILKDQSSIDILSYDVVQGALSNGVAESEPNGVVGASVTWGSGRSWKSCVIL